MDDETLRTLYARRRERRHAPPGLEALLARERTQGRRLRPSLVALAAGAAVVVVAAGITLRESAPDPVPLAEEIMAWRAPTDVLLDRMLRPTGLPDGGEIP